MKNIFEIMKAKPILSVITITVLMLASYGGGVYSAQAMEEGGDRPDVHPHAGSVNYSDLFVYAPSFQTGDGGNISFGNAYDVVGYFNATSGELEWTGEIQFRDNISLADNARVLKHIDLSPSRIAGFFSGSATLTTHGIGNSWEFSDGDTDSVTFQICIPDCIDVSVDPYIKICWSSPTTGGDVNWSLEYLYREYGEDSTASAYDTLNITATSHATQANGMVCTDFLNINNLNTDDKCLICRLTRLGNDGDDTLTDVADLLTVRYYYVCNRLGNKVS